MTKQTANGYITNFLLSGSTDGRIVLIIILHQLTHNFFAGDYDSYNFWHEYKYTEDKTVVNK
jgi:hypothetical protein